MFFARVRREVKQQHEALQSNLHEHSSHLAAVSPWQDQPSFAGLVRLFQHAQVTNPTLVHESCSNQTHSTLVVSTPGDFAQRPAESKPWQQVQSMLGGAEPSKPAELELWRYLQPALAGCDPAQPAEPGLWRQLRSEFAGPRPEELAAPGLWRQLRATPHRSQFAQSAELVLWQILPKPARPPFTQPAALLLGG